MVSINRQISRHPQSFIVDGANTNLFIDSYGIQANTIGNISGAYTLDLKKGNFIIATCTGNITWTFGNPPTSTNAYGMILKLRNGGGNTVTWPTPNTKWPSGTAPTLTVSGNDILSFITTDGGLTWNAVASMLDSR
jgi:hypothetical protein